MSSHHIVRDQQEPALILAEVDTFPFDLLGQLLEWAPYTVCGDAALDQALKYEINLDVVFSDRLNVAEQLAHFPGVEIVRPNENWIEEAVLLLASKGHRAVNVIVGSGFSDITFMERMNEYLLCDFITPSSKQIYVAKEFSKWLTAGTVIKVFGSEYVKVRGGDVIDGQLIKSEDGLLSLCSEKSFIIELGMV